jgi:hypothetical protein
MKIVNRRSTLALSAVVFCLLAGWSGAASPFNKLTYFKFSGAVAIPGAQLEAGEYGFELLNPNDLRNVIKVTDRAHSKLYGIALTRPIHRPAKGSDLSVVTLGESRQGQPTPIKAWFPADETTGYEFIY